MTVPSQSRSHLRGRKRKDGIDVIEAFRALAPSREPIAIQRWSPRRIALTLGAALAGFLLLSWFVTNLSGGGFV